MRPRPAPRRERSMPPLPLPSLLPPLLPSLRARDSLGRRVVPARASLSLLCNCEGESAAAPKKEDGEQDQQRVRWYRGDKNGEGARVSGEPSPGSGRAEHAIAAGDLCTNSYRPTYRPATTTERPMGGRVACPPAFQTDAAAVAPPQGEDVESSLSLSLPWRPSLFLVTVPRLSRCRRR